MLNTQYSSLRIRNTRYLTRIPCNNSSIRMPCWNDPFFFYVLIFRHVQVFVTHKLCCYFRLWADSFLQQEISGGKICFITVWPFDLVMNSLYSLLCLICILLQCICNSVHHKYGPMFTGIGVLSVKKVLLLITLTFNIPLSAI